MGKTCVNIINPKSTHKVELPIIGYSDVARYGPLAGVQYFARGFEKFEKDLVQYTPASSP